MYSFSISRTIAFFVAIASIFPFITPLQLGASGSAVFDTVPPAGWGIFLCATMLLLWWAILVYRVVSAFLSLTYEGSGSTPKRNPSSEKSWFARIRHLVSGIHSKVAVAKRVSLRPTLKSTILVAAFIGVVGSVSIDSVLELVTHNRIVAPQNLGDWQTIIAATVFLVLFSPFVETLIMGATLEPFRRHWTGGPVLPLVSGFAWGLVHAFANHPYQFFSMIWLFFVLSTLYVHTRNQHSFWKTFWVVCTAHAGNNFLALFLIILRQNFL